MSDDGIGTLGKNFRLPVDVRPSRYRAHVDVDVAPVPISSLDYGTTGAHHHVGRRNRDAGEELSVAGRRPSLAVPGPRRRRRGPGTDLGSRLRYNWRPSPCRTAESGRWGRTFGCRSTSVPRGTGPTSTSTWARY